MFNVSFFYYSTSISVTVFSLFNFTSYSSFLHIPLKTYNNGFVRKVADIPNWKYKIWNKNFYKKINSWKERKYVRNHSWNKKAKRGIFLIRQMYQLKRSIGRFTKFTKRKRVFRIFNKIVAKLFQPLAIFSVSWPWWRKLSKNGFQNGL